MATTMVGSCFKGSKLQALYLGLKKLQISINNSGPNANLKEASSHTCRNFSNKQGHFINIKKGVLDVPMPKKPQHPGGIFFTFVKEVEPIIKQKHPEITSQVQMVIKASEMWRDLDPEEKARLTLKRREAYEKYKQEVKNYYDNLTPLQIQHKEALSLLTKAKKVNKERKALGIPSKAPGAFCYFMSEKFRERDPDISAAARLKIIVTRWKEMTEAEKEPYVTLAKQNRDLHESAMNEWEKKMISLGRFDLIRKNTLKKLDKGENLDGKPVSKSKRVTFAPDVKEE
ncbi:transcription factor A, mitochondrial-like [Physella acuta]|uniref:transcription factor A, mitochondrial-like n=1 Tax=Physella acuta TaxID=109671 RepID=UPI0027DC70ED|nr:transcription factor A, mitochondrial-like [Physella acuta]